MPSGTSKSARPTVAKPATKAAAVPAPRMEKPDPELLARLDGVMARLPAYRRPMFGTVSWFVEANAQMFAGVWGTEVIVRLGADGVQRAIAGGRARAFEPMAGRPMREYALVPAASLRPADLKRWIERGLEFASTLEPKKGT